jgi:methylenetetrahydrofolate reductase (NADPH)
LADLKPLAINITWGAGGSTKDQTLELATLTQKEYGIDTVMHLTCTNMVQGSVDDALRVCYFFGVESPWHSEVCRLRKKSESKIS